MLGTSVTYAGLYSNCIVGYGKKDGITNKNIKLTYANTKCNEQCIKSCNNFSRKDHNQSEINEGIINSCMISCRNGKQFTSVYEDEVDLENSYTKEVIGSITVLSMCESDNKPYEMNTGIKFTPGITLNIIPSQSNQIYMCGKQLINLNPIFNKSNFDDWKPDALLNHSDIKQSSHICLYNLDDKTYLNANISKLWNINSNLFANQLSNNESCYWNARNTNYTDTDIYLRQGDLFFISWHGDFGNNQRLNGDFLEYISDLSNDDNSRLSDIYAHKTKNMHALLAFNITQPNTNYQVFDRAYDIAHPINIQQRSKDLMFQYSGINIKIGNQSTTLFGEYIRYKNYISCHNDNNCDIYHLNVPKIDIRPDASCVQEENQDDRSPGFKSACININLCKNINIAANQKKCIPQHQCIIKDEVMQYTTLDDTSGVTLCYPENDKFCPSTQDSTCLKLNNINDIFYVAMVKKISDIENIRLDDQPKRLSLKHYDNDIDSIGGYNVALHWGGCPRDAKDSIQYRFDGKYCDNIWQDITWDNNNPSFEAEAPSALCKGHLLLRVKPLDSIQCPENQPDCAHSHNTFGEFNVGIHVPTLQIHNNQLVHFLGSLITEVYNIAVGQKLSDGNVLCGVSYDADRTMITDNSRAASDGEIGRGRCNGTLYYMYKGLLEESGLFDIVRALLTLYIIFTGIAFAIGIAKMTQHEVLNRIVKVSFVIAMTSAPVMGMVFNYLVPLFIDGAFYLVAVGVYSVSSVFPMPGYDQDVVQDFSYYVKNPGDVATIFDAFIELIFLNGTTYLKLWALMTHSIISFLAAVLCLNCMWDFIVAIAKSMLAYAFAILYLTFLIVITPIAFSMLLFKVTKESLFDNWWKYLVSCALQPMFLFTWTAMIGAMIFGLFNSFLGFTICDGCFIKIGIPGLIEFCLIPGYNMIASMHNPHPVMTSTPFIMQIALVVTMMLLGHAARALPEELVTVITRMVTGSPIRNASVAAPAKAMGDVVGKAVDEGKKATGLDKVSPLALAKKAITSPIESAKAVGKFVSHPIKTTGDAIKNSRVVKFFTGG